MKCEYSVDRLRLVNFKLVINTFFKELLLKEEENKKYIILLQMEKLLKTKFAKFKNGIIKGLNFNDDNLDLCKELKSTVIEGHLNWI